MCVECRVTVRSTVCGLCAAGSVLARNLDVRSHSGGRVATRNSHGVDGECDTPTHSPRRMSWAWLASRPGSWFLLLVLVPAAVRSSGLSPRASRGFPRS
jgi:hypothetical protein